MILLPASPVARLALVVALALSVGAVFRESFASMTALWSLSAYQHAYLVVPVVLWLLWLHRRDLAAEPMRGSLVGLGVLAILLLVWLVSRATAVQAVEHIAVSAMIPALVLAVLGPAAFRSIGFPVLFLLAAVPVGEELIPWLLAVTADVSEWLLRLLGIPVLREGMFFTLPGGSFEVAEVCSGLRNLMAGTVTALLFAYFNFSTWPKRLAFTVFAALSFVLANGVRAFIVMAVASATRGRWLGGEDHIYFGMVLFVVLLLGLLWLGTRFADPPARRSPPPPADPARNRPARVVACGVAGLALMAAAASLQASHESAGAQLLPARLPALDGCSGPLEWKAPWRPELHGPDVETLASYDCGEAQIHVYLASYGHQEQGKELISSGNHLVPHDWRQYTQRREASFEPGPGARVTLNETQVAITARNVLAWHWYDVNGRSSHTRGGTKLNEAREALDPQGVVSSVRMVAVTSTDDDFEAMRALLEKQVRALWPVLAEEPHRSDGG